MVEVSWCVARGDSAPRRITQRSSGGKPPPETVRLRIAVLEEFVIAEVLGLALLELQERGVDGCLAGRGRGRARACGSR